MPTTACVAAIKLRRVLLAIPDFPRQRPPAPKQVSPSGLDLRFGGRFQSVEDGNRGAVRHAGLADPSICLVSMVRTGTAELAAAMCGP